MKPILFNTDMVRAILGGRKTVTRRLVKFDHGQNPQWTGYIPDGHILYGSNNIPAAKAPYRPGDILYVRETWASVPDLFGEFPQYIYRADYSEKSLCMGEGTDEIMTDFPACVKWRPSIHMPKEAARLFLQVTDVRADRLCHIGRADALKEGANPACAVLNFKSIWDSTIKPAERAQYGWNANPWVWVISFDRISREEALKGGDG